MTFFDYGMEKLTNECHFTEIYSLLYAENIIIIQKTYGQLQKAVFILNNILQNYGLKISILNEKLWHLMVNI